MAKIKKKYDAIIFGGGFSGLLSAHTLKSKNQSFLIIEPSDKLGGKLAGWKSQNDIFPSNLNLYSLDNDTHKEQLTWLENALDTRIVDGHVSTQTLHFKDGNLKPLTGFGDKTYEAMDEYNALCFQPEKAKLTQLAQGWVERLISELSEDQFALNHEVTAINFNEDKKATSITLNGKTEVEFENLIWATSPQNILKVIDPQNMSPAEVKKLKRPGKIFDAVILNVVHPNYQPEGVEFATEVENSPLTHNWALSSNSNIFCLYGSQDEFEPVIGTISPQSSCWMTLIPAEQSLDNEFVAKVLKNMKKQIKRPFPTLFDGESTVEKILLSENAYGHMPLKETETGFLKDIPNLFCMSSLCSEQHGLHGTLERAQKLEQSF